MTELEQKAEEYMKSKGHFFYDNKRVKATNPEMKQAYKDGYKQGQKENAELKVELENWKSEWNEQVIKANDEGYARTLQGIEIEKLKAQIEKMKCCGNCKYREHDTLICQKCKNFNKWELAE